MPSLLRLTFLTLLICGGVFWIRATDSAKPVRVLFIGNSYTSTNDLPQMIERLAKAARQPAFEHLSLTPGGATLQQHGDAREAKQLIAAQSWDFVVLQEQSLTPLLQPQQTIESVRRLNREIKSTQAKALLFLTWARQSKPETQASLNKVYQKAADETGALIAPVGMAWAAALKDDPTLVLHNSDGSHPTLADTYLSACVFYATIYRQSPEGLPALNSRLNPKQAQRLQAIAWRTVEEFAKNRLKR